ncbi:MAG: hypothetical protein ACXABY_27345 [Candidatus Thorarchaeota archaeon]|jgi:hypothetical protein
MSEKKRIRRPLTQREIRQQKEKAANIKYVTIINKLNGQTIPIQLKAPSGHDWFAGEQTVMLYPKRMGRFPQDRLYPEQIKNFQKSGRIQVLNVR